MTLVKAIIMALSLCADCYAVSLCSGVTLKRIDWKSILYVALGFAVIQSGLLLAGWAFGNLFVGLIFKISHLVGFLLLLYVGGGMFIEGVKSVRCGCEDEVRDLNGLKNIILGGIATSIDALAVGVSQSMVESTQEWPGFSNLFYAVFAVTALSVIAGILSGRAVGRKFGSFAEIVGGLVLVGIGASLLF